MTVVSMRFLNLPTDGSTSSGLMMISSSLKVILKFKHGIVQLSPKVTPVQMNYLVKFFGCHTLASNIFFLSVKAKKMLGI